MPERSARHLGDALSALLDGELSAAEVEAARAHLADCATCRAEHDAVAQARWWVRSLPPVEPPAVFYRRVLGSPAPALVAAGGAPGNVVALRRRRVGVAALAACAAATVAVLGLTSPHDPSTSPPVGRFIEAHATAVGGGDPVSHLVPVGVPVSFRR